MVEQGSPPDILKTFGIQSIFETLLYVLETPAYNGSHEIQYMASKISTFVTAMDTHKELRDPMREWGYQQMVSDCKREVAGLTQKSMGHQLSAQSLTEAKIRDFELSKTATSFSQHSPKLWHLLQELLSSDERATGARRENTLGIDTSEDVVMGDGGGNQDGEGRDAEDCDGDDGGSAPQDRAKSRRRKLMNVQTVVIMSILLKSSNQKANALQVVMGVFLHACGTPDTVRELLSALGLTISTTSINNAITSLASTSEQRMKEIGKTPTLFAYDNLDMDFRNSLPTADRAHDSQAHLTTGTMLPLHHVTPEDLDCATQMREKCPPGAGPSIPAIDLLRLHEFDEDVDGLLPRDRFNRSKFLSDLVHHGPKYFHQFKPLLEEPEVYEAIPISKTTQVPNRTLDVKPDTAASNGEAIILFLLQAGIGDAKETKGIVTDIGNKVVLVSGDLLTGERIRSLLVSRLPELTSWNRMEFVVYVMGLFHLKMACADAIWRTFIQPAKAKQDLSSLMGFVQQLRPNETGKIGSKPSFRQMHEVIQHVGVSLRLDNWRIAANKRDPLVKSLDEFAETSPTWDEIVQMATRMCTECVAPNDIETEIRTKPLKERDMQNENILMMQQYFLLYEEITHAMNVGDIGRVESCFIPWMMIFLGCGKHKYAAELRRYLEEVHFKLPEGIK
ncbi:hypothetical protein ONZ45_g7144 [Pleurotus djamor]|nr:hypothetical protein ONZ45_g7144 [Pleurotus djamor]